MNNKNNAKETKAQKLTYSRIQLKGEKHKKNAQKITEGKHSNNSCHNACNHWKFQNLRNHWKFQ